MTTAGSAFWSAMSEIDAGAMAVEVETSHQEFERNILQIVVEWQSGKWLLTWEQKCFS